MASPSKYVDEVMTKNFIKVCSIYDDKESIVLNMKKFNLYTLPVINLNKSIIGIIKYNDLVNSITSLKDETIYDSIFYSIKKRSPWLIVNLFTVFICNTPKHLPKHPPFTKAKFHAPPRGRIIGQKNVKNKKCQNWSAWRAKS